MRWFKLLEIGFVALAQVAGGVQHERRHVVARRQLLAASTSRCRPLSSQIRAKKPMTRGSSGRFSTPRAVALQLQAVRNHVDPRPIHRQIVGHEIGVVVVERDKRIDIRRPLAQVGSRFVVIRRRQLLQKQILARKLAHHRRAAPLANHPRHADLHRVRQMHDVRLHFRRAANATSFSISLRWCPASPRSIETVMPPKLRRIDARRPAATAAPAAPDYPAADRTTTACAETAAPSPANTR